MDTKAESSLGALVRLTRQQRGWTLRQMSAEVGIPVSTLGKIETDKLSLSYDKLQQLTARLGLTMTDFLSRGSTAVEAVPAPQVLTGRKSVTTDDTSVHIETPNYDYTYLCTDLRDKRMIPVLATIRSHSMGEFGNLVHHRGEEFIFVLEGTIEVHTQLYTPIVVSAGCGIYLDSTMGHAYVTKDCETARILAVHSGDDPELADELLSIPENRGQEAV